VVSWRPLSHDGGGVEVTTSSGERYTADQMVVSAGAWMGQMVPEIKVGIGGAGKGRQCKMSCLLESIGLLCPQASVDLTMKESLSNSYLHCFMLCVLQELCVPVRQVVAWFDCPPDKFKKEAFPGKSTHIYDYTTM